MGSWEDPEGVGGGQTVISIFCMKRNLFPIIFFLIKEPEKQTGSLDRKAEPHKVMRFRFSFVNPEW